MGAGWNVRQQEAEEHQQKDQEMPPQAGKGEKVLIYPHPEKIPAPVTLGEFCCMSLGRTAALNNQLHPTPVCFPAGASLLMPSRPMCGDPSFPTRKSFVPAACKATERFN